MYKYIGIDVAKSTLQVFIPQNELDLELENNAKSLNKLYGKLKKIYKKDIDADVGTFGRVSRKLFGRLKRSETV